ncbi:autotransporter domain-containing protein [Fusobacterium sp.]|uniref:autotransporter outer membrane beta-barrel domain-containing protein n=1 Tax=Fusobacterium sp. TaxID=68766 RepID=UPI0025DFF8AF|nr:autotransporter domain-containing protein [Fusobacterium sp.]MDY3060543.1 autotransporter domain-containing protein [Fusobacterium sp.]MEE1476985.1 autotransporter domain-containing protein [Fusobacterium sp.]
MGTNKKLLILSLLIVGSNLVYSASELDKYDGKTQSVNGGKEYENNIEQTINSGKWLHITDGKVTNNETGKIVVTGSGPIAQFAGEKAEFLNKGNIEVQNGKGFYNGNGTLINDGTITVKKGIGVQLKGEKATFKNNKTLNVIGGNGAEIAQGNGDNTGEINVSGGNGIYFNGIDSGKKGEFINEGTINVSGGNGVNFGKVEGEAIFTNKNTINVTGGAGANVGKGNFTNEGTINVSGGKGLYITGGKVTNQSNIVVNSGTGLQIKNSTKGEVINSGNILIKGGTGIDLAGGNFTNSGIIDAGINGVAIKSSTGTNNTLFIKSGNKIIGTVKGSTGVDVLAVEGGSTYENLAITGYDKIVSLKNENSTDDAIISNSNISLGFNQGTDNYINGNKKLNGDKTGLTIKNSNLVVDLTNKTEGSSLVDTGDGKLTLDGNMKIAFNGSNGEKEFNISEILGDEIEADSANFESSAMWNYITNENGDLIAKKKSYSETVGKSQLEDFGKVLEQNENIGGDFGKGLTLLGLLDASQFTDAMTQLSGGVHGYTVDFAAINSRTLSNIIKNRELNKDRLRDKALNSYDQEVAYINNNHKIGGLMNVDYNEDGVLGITEKQIMPNGKLGLVYGGAKGKAKFENGKHGKANMDNLYLGGYYAYDFTDNLTLVSNANFVYSHTNVTRNIKFAKDNQYLNYSYDSTYPVFGVGGGATLYYTPYDSSNNSVTLYGGIDWIKIVQGNINENSDMKEEKNNQNLTIKNIPVDEQMYDSVVPHIGLSLANNGYIFNRKYRLGVNVDYETELGNIKNGKKLKLSALSTPHRVETAERENIVSYSLNGALDLTEDFTIYGNYTKADSDEYDAERVEAGFKYKMDRMSDLFVTSPLLGNIENSKSYSRRWTGVASFILDGEDDSDRSYYTEPIMGEEHSRGDYATSLKLKPKFTLSLKDRDTKWSYYFETYYMSNGMGIDLDKNERRKSETRLHGEARWSDQYSKGRYGFNIGYRNETSSAPTLSVYVGADRLKRGTHQFRFTPNFTYNLGNGFVFGGSTTGIIAYDYEGYRKGQTDFELENEYGITYNGLMPRWRFNVNYFREETWYDNDFRKPSRVKNNTTGVYEYIDVEGDRRYQSNQLRPRITYFFGNGGRVELSARIPLGNGYWYTSDDHGKKTAEKYETRYGVKYYQPIAPGLTGMIGGEILTIKTKNTDHGNSNYGKETRDYSIRPTIGISYNF